MPRLSRRWIWLLGGVAVVGYLVWSTLSLRTETGGISVTAPPARIGIDLPRAATPSPATTPQPREGTFILLSAGSVTHNSVVSVSGYGFPEGDTIDVTFRDQVVGTAVADKAGQFSGINVPVGTDLAPGVHTVRAASPTLLAEATFEVVPGSPYVEPSAYFGKPGSTVRFGGGGFLPGERVTVHFDSLGAPAIGEMSADEGGRIAFEAVPIPLASEGEHAFLIVGEQSRVPARVPFSVSGFYPWVTLSPYQSQPLRPVGVAGQDWAPGEQILVYLNGGPGEEGSPAAIVRANELGQFEVADAFRPPIEAMGEATVLFYGQRSGRSATATLTVEPFAPQVQLTNYAGPPGAEVAFVGQGYAPGERVVAYLGGTTQRQPVATFNADGNGGFEGAGSFRIPFGTPAGDNSITVMGEVSKVPISVEVAVLPMTPTLTLTMYAGRPGDTLGFSGVGFAPGERVRVFTGEGEGLQEVATLSVGPQGEFTDEGSFTVPAGAAAGKITFTATGELSQVPATADFEVLPADAGGGAGEAVPTPAGP